MTQQRTLSADSMKLLYMRGKLTKIGRVGIVDKIDGCELVYWNDCFYTMRKQSVYTRIDMRKYQTAYVYDAQTDAFICTAALQHRMPGIVSDIQKSDLKEMIQRKNRDLKQARLAILSEKMNIDTVMKNQALAVKAIAAENVVQPIPGAVHTTIITTQMDHDEKMIKLINEKPDIDTSAYDSCLPDSDCDDIDVWGERSVVV
jgi:hypothetical protein